MDLSVSDMTMTDRLCFLQSGQYLCERGVNTGFLMLLLLHQHLYCQVMVIFKKVQSQQTRKSGKITQTYHYSLHYSYLLQNRKKNPLVNCLIVGITNKHTRSLQKEYQNHWLLTAQAVAQEWRRCLKAKECMLFFIFRQSFNSIAFLSENIHHCHFCR